MGHSTCGVIRLASPLKISFLCLISALPLGCDTPPPSRSLRPQAGSSTQAGSTPPLSGVTAPPNAGNPAPEGGSHLGGGRPPEGGAPPPPSPTDSVFTPGGRVWSRLTQAQYMNLIEDALFVDIQTLGLALEPDTNPYLFTSTHNSSFTY